MDREAMPQKGLLRSPSGITPLTTGCLEID
ncbi:hypothetical protein BW33_04731 [Pseudomonas sp. RIT288]|nr:hypothetical protein BW33_04731 [Pseudomonas sp. RIT288]